MINLKSFVFAAAIIVLCIFMCGCAGRRANVSHLFSETIHYVGDSNLAREITPLLNEHPGQSGFHLLAENLDAFAMRVLMAEAADRTLDVQYYLMHADQSGWLFDYYLLKAADRGVRVRILLDDMDTAGRGFKLSAFDRHPNIEIRLFNPFAMRGPLRVVEFVIGTNRVGRRMHNKAFIADNTLAVIGGRNIGDEYFSARPDRVFADLDVLAVGPVVKNVSHSFDVYWNSEWAVPIQAISSARVKDKDLDEAKRFLEAQFGRVQESPYGEVVRETDLVGQLRKKERPLVWSNAGLLYDLPQKIESNMMDKSTHLSVKMRPILENTQWELLLISPYFVPARDELALFEKLRKRGVRIRIITNSLASNDVAIVHSGYSRYREELLELGVELYEFKPTAPIDGIKRKMTRREAQKAGLHAKSIILDRQKVFIGSTNLDPRSRIHNTEITMMVDSPELAGQMVDRFNEVTSPFQSYRVDFRANDEASRGRPPGLVWITEEDGRIVRYYNEPLAGFWRRLGVTLVKPLPIENLL